MKEKMKGAIYVPPMPKKVSYISPAQVWAAGEKYGESVSREGDITSRVYGAREFGLYPIRVEVEGEIFWVIYGPSPQEK